MSDSKKLRISLILAGFDSERIIYSDTFKKDRRLKINVANDIFEAPQKKQKKLLKNIKNQFGDRFANGYFIRGRYNKQLCIRLQHKK